MKFFLIGVGGTGMRCLEAFVHLCAIGMLDNKEIEVLSLDTDTNNGNKSQSENLINTYIKIKKDASGAQAALRDSFFSAKLNLYRFAPQYSGSQRSFSLISRLGQDTNRKVNKENEDLTNLLFDPEAQEFDLSYGYRAQTHLGSYLMYHAILEEVQRVKNGHQAESPYDLMAFLKRLSDAAQSGQSVKVFIFGSIFGGTGASSIPVIPRAIKDALHLRDPNANFADELIFGSTLLTNYFTFNKPKNQQLMQERVIADAEKFSLNSQAALMFYESDPTIRNIYQRMYHIGWPSRLINFDEGRSNEQINIGGAEQRNRAHVLELLCASAAYDFFVHASDEKGTHKILYRTVSYQNERFNFSFSDFVGREEQYRLMNKLTAFFAMCFMVENKLEGNIKFFADALAREYNITDYKELTEEEARHINHYLKAFAFSYEGGAIRDGWLRQVQQSSTDESFLFSVGSFQADVRGLQKFNWGQLLDAKEYQFEGSGGIFSSPNPYSKFMDKFRKEPAVRPEADFESAKPGERLLNHLYKAFTALHKIIK